MNGLTETNKAGVSAGLAVIALSEALIW